MIIDTAVRVSWLSGGKVVDTFVAQSSEGAVEFAVEMLRRRKQLLAGDRIVVEGLADFLYREHDDLFRKELQT